MEKKLLLIKKEIDECFYLEKKYFFKLITFIIFLFGSTIFAQSDNCGTGPSEEITVGVNSCTPQTMNTNWLANSGYWNGATGCNSDDRDDVWAWFQATSTSTTITYTPVSNRDAILHIFDEVCDPNMNSLACSDIGGNGVSETIVYTTTIGTIYKIRAQRRNSNWSMDGTICVFNTVIPVPPTITSLSATSGCEGSDLIINGANLNGATSVTIGGTPATITANTANSITVTVGAGTTGNVIVTTGFPPAATSTSAFTVIPAPVDPGNPTSNSPQCNPLGVTITQNISDPVGPTYYWQTTPLGTSIANNASTPWVVNSSGTYYIRALNGTCWSNGSGSVTVIVNDPINGIASTPSPTHTEVDVCAAGHSIVSNLSWSAVTDAISYDVYFGAGSLPGIVTSNVATNSYPVTLAMNTTYYWQIVPIGNCGPTTGTPTIWSFTTLNTPCVCVPVSTNNTSYIDDFNAVGLTTINNNTGAGITSSGYSDYTNLSVTTIESGVINFDVDFSGFFSTYGFNIWIDWDDDSVFTNAELVYASGAEVFGATGSFPIPFGTAGTHIMRIRADLSSSDPDPCTLISSGEAEDYTIIIIALTCLDNPINLSSTSTTTSTATINWTNPATLPANGFEYIISIDNSVNTPADDLTGTSFGPSLNVTGLTMDTTYYFFIRSDCGSGDFGLWQSSLFNTGCVDNISPLNICTTIIDEQGTDPFITDPFIADPNFALDCDKNSFILEANSNLKETTSYKVEKIDYPSPDPLYDFPIIGNGITQPIGTDDVWASSRTDLDFNFCFYGNTYTQTLVGANSVITFDSGITPGSYCEWAFSSDIPNAFNLWEQTIFGVYHDIDPTGMTGSPIKSRTIGTTPCRQFQVSWTNIPMYADDFTLYTGMIVLHETTNIIDVFMEEKRIENFGNSIWNDGNAVVGLQGDISNNEYVVAPCRNSLDTNWGTSKEAWRFTPNGADINPVAVTWYEGSINPANQVASNPDNSITVNRANTYYAVSNYSLCSGVVDLTDEVDVQDYRKVWDGSESTDWYTSGNWKNDAIPTATDCVIIPDVTTTFNRSPIVVGGPPIPPLPGLGRTLRVESNGYLELLQYANLIITDDIYIEDVNIPNGKILLRDGANLIQKTNVASNNNTGIIQMQRTVNNLITYDYVYWSSPVDDFSVNDVSPGSAFIYEWVPTIAGNGVGHYGNWQASGEIMQPGKGYIIRGVNGTNPETTTATNTVEFKGKPRNGNYSMQISHGGYSGGTYPGAGTTVATELDDNWNLIGNPYPSAISADKFITQNAALFDGTPDPNTPTIMGTVYLWRHQSSPISVTDPFYGDFSYNYNPNDYIGYNSTGSNPAGFYGSIASGQAFFVLMDHNVSTTNTVLFNNDMRVDSGNAPLDNNQFYRNSNFQRTESFEKHRIWLDLISPNNLANSILVGYVENATNEIDRLYDGNELSETSTRFYSLIGEEKMSIQGKALPFEDSDTVSLGIVIPENGNYTIAINSLDGLFDIEDQPVYLEDTYTNIIHDLRVNPYTFNIDIGTYDERFILRYNNETLDIDDFEQNSGLEIIAPNNSYIKVKSGISPIDSVFVYDLLGRLLIEQKGINAFEFRINNSNYSEGSYVVKAVLLDGKQKLQKVVLRR